MIKFTQCSSVVAVATFLALASPFGYSDDLKNSPANSEDATTIEIGTSTGLSLLDMPMNFPATFELNDNEPEIGDISLFAIGDNGSAWNINTNINYNNAFDSTTTNHYYQFEIEQPSKITGRAWNLPSTSNLDIALWHLDTETNLWNLIALSQLGYVSEEQLSAIAEPGSYMFEVARITSLDVNPYNFTITTTNLAVDSNEPNDNFWQSTIMESFSNITATLDNDYDKDYFFFTTANEISINYRLTGGDFTATLYYDNGTPAFTLPNNTLQRITLPAGSYFWSISSPSNDVSSGKSYTFEQLPHIHELTFTLQTDPTYTRRVDYGRGKHFHIYDDADVWGTAYDANGDPIANATIRFTAKSSVTSASDITTTTTTDSQGNYSFIMYSPSGAAQYTRQGAGLLYHYDLHPVVIQSVDQINGAYLVTRIVEIDDVSQVTSLNGYIILNDVAYYTNN